MAADLAESVAALPAEYARTAYPVAGSVLVKAAKVNLDRLGPAR